MNEEVALASVVAVEGNGSLEEDTRSDDTEVGVGGGDEHKALALGLPCEGGDGVCGAIQMSKDYKQMKGITHP